MGIFGSICSEVENELKARLSRLGGFLVRGYLPQHWVFRTDLETVTFCVDGNGNASVMAGASSTPDVTIDIDHQYLSTVLRARSRPSFPPQWFNVSSHTPKGKTAFNFLRGRFGL